MDHTLTLPKFYTQIANEICTSGAILRLNINNKSDNLLSNKILFQIMTVSEIKNLVTSNSLTTSRYFKATMNAKSYPNKN